MDRYQKFIEEKARKKRQLLGQTFFPRKPVLLIDVSQGREPDFLPDLIGGFISIGLNVLILKSAAGTTLQRQAMVHYVEPENKLAAMGAADFTIVFDSDITTVWKHGSVPIAQMNGKGTVNYNPLQETGNGFYFESPTKWEIFAAVVRALETYQFPYDWENLLREILARRE